MNLVFICAAGTCGYAYGRPTKFHQPESAIDSRTWNVGAKLFGKFTMHYGDIYTNLLKHPAFH